jgi:hypothetical protein
MCVFTESFDLPPSASGILKTKTERTVLKFWDVRFSKSKLTHLSVFRNLYSKEVFVICYYVSNISVLADSQQLF